jgi:hypothetical protein
VKKARTTAAAGGGGGGGERDASAERREKESQGKRATEMAKLLRCALLLISHLPSSIPKPHYSWKFDLHPLISG